MNTILPIGSVVKIRGVEKPLMIFGYLQQTAACPGKLVDYVAVPYPGGNVNIAMQLGFQMTDITEVLFEGYTTEEFEPMKVLLAIRKAEHSKRSIDEK